MPHQLVTTILITVRHIMTLAGTAISKLNYTPVEEARYRALKGTKRNASGSIIIRERDFEVHYTSPLDLST